MTGSAEAPNTKVSPPPSPSLLSLPPQAASESASPAATPRATRPRRAIRRSTSSPSVTSARPRSAVAGTVGRYPRERSGGTRIPGPDSVTGDAGHPGRRPAGPVYLDVKRLC